MSCFLVSLYAGSVKTSACAKVPIVAEIHDYTHTPSNSMDAAEHEAARAKELTRLNASAKGFRSQYVSTRNVLMQALPLYADKATASKRRTIDEAIARVGLQADTVHDAYQRLIKIDDDERHPVTFETRQDNTANKHNNICAHADEVLGEADGPQHQQQQSGQIQGDIVAATVAAMNAANGGNASPKKIDYHQKPKILGKASPPQS
jgi:hypothetical protein